MGTIASRNIEANIADRFGPITTGKVLICHSLLGLEVGDVFDDFPRGVKQEGECRGEDMFRIDCGERSGKYENCATEQSYGQITREWRPLQKHVIQ